MSKNVRALCARQGVEGSLLTALEAAAAADGAPSDDALRRLAKAYRLSPAAVLGTASFYDFLVVQELFMTETAAIADVVLPASSHFEKSGTFTNGERRIQRVNQVVEPLEGTRPDGQIVVEVRSRRGATHLCARVSDQVRPGVLFTTFHFPEVAINHLTSGVFDQDSMTPEYKVVAVGIARAE